MQASGSPKGASPPVGLPGGTPAGSASRPPPRIRREWVGGIIGLVVLVAALVVLAYLFWPEPPVSPHTEIPLASALGMSNVENSTLGAHHWYNTSVFSIASPLASLTLAKLPTQLRNGTDPIRPAWTILVYAQGDAQPVGTYSVSEAACTAGGTTTLVVGDVYSLDAGTANVTNDSWTFGPVGFFGGTVNLPLS